MKEQSKQHNYQDQMLEPDYDQDMEMQYGEEINNDQYYENYQSGDDYDQEYMEQQEEDRE